MIGWIAGGAVLAGGAYIAPPMALRALQTRALAARCARTRSLVLTFDDGPSEHLTARVLDLLASRGVRATFFLLGRRVQAAPQMVDRIAEAGHEIGCHSRNHEHAWKTMPWVTPLDIRRGFADVKRWRERPIFRPPYGKLTLPGLLVARGRASGFGWWTVDSQDTWADPRTPEQTGEAVRERGGGVVLLHDHDRGEERASLVLGVVERLLDLADAESWRVRTLGDVLGEGDG